MMMPAAIRGEEASRLQADLRKNDSRLRGMESRWLLLGMPGVTIPVQHQGQHASAEMAGEATFHETVCAL